MPDAPSNDIASHSGNKYIRRIVSCTDHKTATLVDVYAVLKAFNVTCPATAHAVKKLLCTGVRGKADAATDLSEARDAITRAMQMVEKDSTDAKTDRFRKGYGGRKRR